MDHVWDWLQQAGVYASSIEALPAPKSGAVTTALVGAGGVATGAALHALWRETDGPERFVVSPDVHLKVGYGSQNRSAVCCRVYPSINLENSRGYRSTPPS